MIKNKKFVDLSNGKVFEVIDQFEDIAILDNKSKVKVGKLLDKNFFDEYIDPNSFFRNDRLVNAFTEKIRQLPLEDTESTQKYEDYVNESVKVEATVKSTMSPAFTDSAVLPYDPEEEKRELMEKAKRMFNAKNTTNTDSLRHLLDDDSFEESPQDNNYNQIVEQPKITKTITPPTQMERNIQSIPSQQNQGVDPIISMFRNVKRNNDFSLSFSINQKIPRLDFIEMMEDSYNTSIIDFLAEEFTNLILLNPDLIKSKISEEIRNLVYNKQNITDSESENKTIKNSKKSKPSDND